MSTSRFQLLIDRLVVLSAISAFYLHGLLVGLYGGLGFGASSVSDYTYVPAEFRGSGISLSNSDPYMLLTNAMVPITWLLACALIVKVFARGWILNSVATVFISIALVFTLLIEMLRRPFVSDLEPYLNGLREGSRFFLEFVVVLLIAWILQIVSLLLAIRSHRYGRTIEKAGLL
jgi:hypothetical protein